MKTTTPPDQDSADALTEALYNFISRQQAKYRQLYDDMEAAGRHEKAQFYRGFCHGFGEIISVVYRLKKQRQATNPYAGLSLLTTAQLLLRDLQQPGTREFIQLVRRSNRPEDALFIQRLERLRDLILPIVEHDEAKLSTDTAEEVRNG